MDQAGVRRWMADRRPDAVVMAAAKVGGILANDRFPVDFLQDNLVMQTNVIDSAFRSRGAQTAVSRLVLHLSEVRAAADRARMPC